MKHSFLSVTLRFIFLFCFLLPIRSWALTLPAPDAYLTGPNGEYTGVPLALQFGDFYSYSLPILAVDYDVHFGGGTGVGNPFYVASNPGSIKDDIVIYTGSSGQDVTTNGINMDDAYPSPNSKTYPFDTTVTDDPGGPGEFLGDSSTTWDIALTALTDYLDGSPLVFFFNHNEEGGDNQDILGWADVYIVDEDGLRLETFSFKSPAEDPNNPYVTSVGPVDLEPFTTVLENNYGTINHNLGANQAAYANWSPGLDAYLAAWKAGSYEGAVTMQVELHLKNLSNGYEQLFIQSTDAVTSNTPTPEPATMVLLGIGLLGLAGVSRRKINSPFF